MKEKRIYTAFELRVFAATKRIPRGKASTYSEIARAIGAPTAARAVGNALNKSPGMPRCPCHRVVRSDGTVGGFASGTKKKIQLLRNEGIAVREGKVDLTKFCIKFIF